VNEFGDGLHRFDGETIDHRIDSPRLSPQLVIVRDELRKGWRTLSDLQAVVSDALGRPVSEAGVSARVRDLRKNRFGNHTVERRRVSPTSGLWEYRLAPLVGQKEKLSSWLKALMTRGTQ
jgi:hypothetical protein